MRTTLRSAALATGLLAILAGCSVPATHSSASASPSAPASASVSESGPAPASSSRATKRAIPKPAHVVIVIEENKSYGEVRSQPFLSSLAAHGANFTHFRAETHPSEPNYVALWSGSKHGLDSDACPVDFGKAPSLGSQLLRARKTAVVYSEGLPRAGYTGCSAGRYARKHNPLADFNATSGAAHNKPFSAFPSNYSKLPTVAMVIPNLDHDMHDGSVPTGDAWLKRHLSRYATWARTHNSLLVVTFDEDDGTARNRIYTVIDGQHVRRGDYSESVNHYALLHTVERSLGLSQLGTHAAPITDIWR